MHEAYAPDSLTLYVRIHQVFSVWAIPFYSAPVDLVSVLQLSTNYSPLSGDRRYYIQSQEDLYQVNEVVKFFSLFRVLWLGLWVWQALATLACVVAQTVFAPVSWWEERRAIQTAKAIEDS